MFDPNLIIYFNGKYQKLSDTKISPMTHSLHYGTGVFEGIRSYQIKKGVGIFRLRDHINRLFYSAEKLKLKIKEDKEEIMDICREVIKRNKLKNSYLRPLIFLDDSSLGMTTETNKTITYITAFPWSKYLKNEVSVKISSYRRISEHSTFCDAKISGHYVNSLLANLETKETPYDEPLLLDHRGAIAEGAVANIFFIKENELHTPQTGKILPGITRDSVIFLAKKLNYRVIEREIFPQEIENFQGAFFTGTASEITIIKKIALENNQEINFDTATPLPIKEKFDEVVGVDSADEFNWFN